MRNQNMNTHARFVEALATFGVGTFTLILDWFKYGTVLIGFFGACLALLGGFEAWRAKRTERKVHELEVTLREREIARLEEGMRKARSPLSDGL
jgi:hypothetical protein